MKESNVTRKRKFDDNIIVNAETGEIAKLPPSSSCYIEEVMPSFALRTKNYVSITPEAITYLTEVCKKADIAKVMSMSANLRESFCIVFNSNNRPHNFKSLAKYLKMSEDELYKLIGRLVRKNILAYTVCSPSGHLEKIFMLNPYVVRKRTEISNVLKVIFRDVTKDILE